jgi:hypothetical protein
LFKAACFFKFMAIPRERNSACYLSMNLI